MRLSSINSDVARAKRIIMERGVIEDQELFRLLALGIGKFYWVKKIIQADNNFVVRDGLFMIRRLEPQKTLDEPKESEVIEP